MKKNRWWMALIAGSLLLPAAGCLDLTTPRIPDDGEEESDTPDDEDDIAGLIELRAPVLI